MYLVGLAPEKNMKSGPISFFLTKNLSGIIIHSGGAAPCQSGGQHALEATGSEHPAGKQIETGIKYQIFVLASLGQETCQGFRCRVNVQGSSILGASTVQSASL